MNIMVTEKELEIRLGFETKQIISNKNSFKFLNGIRSDFKTKSFKVLNSSNFETKKCLK